jgi:UDP-N-acetylmuramoyl-L-alanyl-D-glutamate--2,6-diaminopimelate ligase
MLIAELLKNVPCQTSVDTAIAVKGLACDSRAVKPGDAFFAIAGGRDDGLKYAADAVRKGAIAIVTDAKKIPDLSGVPVFKVADARLALSHAAARFHGEPTRSFKLVGVTGTNGKTTLTYLLEMLWSPEKVGVVGTINTRYAGVTREATHTTPDPTALNELFSDMRDAGVTAVAMEVSSHALDQKRVAGCEFDACLFTNLTQDHLDYHKDMESYYLAKRTLFTECLAKSTKPAKRAVLNADDPFGSRLAAELKGIAGVEARTFSAKSGPADMVLKHAEYSFSGTRAELSWNGVSLVLETSLIGAHNVQNVMAAVLAVAPSPSEAAAFLAKLSHVTIPGRLERVSGRNVFVDYAHTPDALQNVISALADVRRRARLPGRLITVFGCGGDRDRGKRPLMGRIAAALSDVVLVTSDNPRTENPDKIVEDIMFGVEDGQHAFDGTSGYVVEVDRERALVKAAEIAGDEDIVLVAGKGHEDYQIVGTEKRHFDDREILAELLK